MSSEEMKAPVNSELVKRKSASESPWKRLLAASFIMISAFIYFATYDMAGSLVKIIENRFKIEAYEFEYLYTFYGVPAIFVCIFGGLLIDKVFGIYKAVVYFALVALLGQSVITLGGFLDAYWMMVCGRFIYGIGTESLIISLNCIIYLWFKGKEISFVFGMFQSFLRLGTSFAFFISVPLHQKLEESGSVDKKYVFGLTLMPFLLLVVVQVINVALLSYFTYKNMRNEKQSTLMETDVNITQVIVLPLKYWILIAMFCTSTSTIYSFVSCSQEFFENKYGMSLDQANHFSTFFNLFTSISIPFIGILMNIVGFDLTVNLIGCALGVFGQFILTFTQWNPYFPLIVYSISMTILNICTMPLVPLIVEEFQVATAYGVLQSLINAASSMSQIVAGYILSNGGPAYVTLFFTISLLFGLICTILLLIMNYRDNGILNLSPKKRRALQI